jgi:hypothetical protein
VYHEIVDPCPDLEGKVEEIDTARWGRRRRMGKDVRDWSWRSELINGREKRVTVAVW